MISLYEIYWILGDIYIALKCFFKGESIPQTFLTLTMFYVGVDVNSVTALAGT